MRRARWFLRPRGDAPRPRRERKILRPVPPPTRRCTALLPQPEQLASGSSAHAEMHRVRRERRSIDRRFLRPRGDAPLSAWADCVRARVPPPTRRCTFRIDHERRGKRGSSAHAEMHRLFHAHHVARYRFLRPRGDAPRPGSGWIPKLGVPPPTRRCTDSSTNAISGRLGSSAHAEMHPCWRTVAAAGSRFLRPRGDAPQVILVSIPGLEVPPPTRRCTSDLIPPGLRLDGSSAHAEMHPGSSRRLRGFDGFLRPRGDAPPMGAHRRHLVQVPPPTRRCTAILAARASG